jgi:glycosyltransferase involved in cell wall biosynthesis
MKILLLINSLSGGGAERVVQTLTNHFNALDDHEVVVVVLETLKDAYTLDDGTRKRVLRTGPLCRGLGKILSMPLHAYELARIIKEERPDASVSFLVRANLVHVMSHCFGNNNPILISERTTSQNRYKSKGLKNYIMRGLIRWLYPKAARVIAISNGVKDSLLSFGVCPSKIRVMYNPQPLQTFRELAAESSSVQMEQDARILVTVGRLVDLKDHVTLIHAFAKVREDADVRLYIIGDGPNRKKLESLAQALGLADDIRFLGWQPNPFALLKQADIFVLSSRFEGFPNVIVEAMACGLPVISTDCPSGPHEILRGGEAGVLVPVGDVDALARAITTLLSDRQTLTEYARKSKSRVKDFDVSLVASEYLEFLKT